MGVAAGRETWRLLVGSCSHRAKAQGRSAYGRPRAGLGDEGDLQQVRAWAQATTAKNKRPTTKISLRMSDRRMPVVLPCRYSPLAALIAVVVRPRQSSVVVTPRSCRLI